MIAPSRLLLVDFQSSYCAARDLSPQTEKFYLYGVRALEAWAKHPVTVRFAAEHLNEYLRDLAATKNRYTAGSYRSSLLTLLRAAQAEGLCELPPKVRPIRRPEHRPRGWRADEMGKLLEHASPIQRAAIRLGYDTGLRRGDLFDVRWSQVVGQRDDYRVIHTPSKTGRQITRRIRNETYDDLDALRNPDDDRLLPSEVKHSAWRKRWHKLGAAAGVDTSRRALQAIRRTGASLTKREGGSAAEYLGHSPQSGDLATRYYIDPELVDEAPPLPPAIL